VLRAVARPRIAVLLLLALAAAGRVAGEFSNAAIDVLSGTWRKAV
jgi:hypothetical protein